MACSRATPPCARLNGVSFELEAGKTLAVVGESGCGKSTLARALTLIEEPSSGSLKIAGQEVAGADKAQRKQLRKDVQMVFQSPYASLNPRQKIGDQLAEPLLINTSLIGRRTSRESPGDDGAGGLASRALPALSAHVLRRPAPADRPGSRDDAAAKYAGGG